MIRLMPATATLPPAIRRLSLLAPLDSDDIATLHDTVAHAHNLRVRRELIVEGREIAQPYLILSGWAARVRILLDGRRQFLSFLLPGDLIGMCDQSNPVASSTVVTLTEVSVCTAPDAEPGSGLSEAYAVSRALEEAYLLAQIARLGRMSALERIADLFLELHERLAMCGLTAGRSYELPITQEILADVLGLTAVHVNRMLQSARRTGDLSWSGGRLTIADPQLLARQVGRVSARVSAV